MLTATYASDLSRVRLSFTSAPGAADYALIERSTDQITWTTVRGGSTVTITSGAGSLDDYEFTPGSVTYYRASYVDTADPAGIAVGTAVYGNNASVTPGLPAGALDGDLVLLLASIRNSGTGTVNTPAGWTQMFASGNMTLLGKRYVSGDTAPTITFANGVANADTMAQSALWRNTELVPVSSNSVLNASAQNVAWPGLTLPASTRTVLQLMWKQDDLTSVATPSGAAPIGTLSSTTGDDASMYWSAIFTALNAPPVASGTFTVTGGAAAISRGALVALRAADYVTRDTASITPALTQVWIKNLARPYMNTSLSNPVGLISIERKARAGIFDVVGRQLPVAVTDLRAGKTYTIGAQVTDATERTRLDLILSAGNTVLLQFPPSVRLSPMYAVIGDSTYDDESSTYTLPLTEVAAPASTVVGATVLWQDIVSTYATWADLIAAKSTWADVLDIIGSPTNIITG
ncbi:MAG TPA: hypothetical protein VJT49_14845 [Amycolatopsis sp.]|uniref:hypothetical protein n=1 Tax=Amycolatopsis sp. TaxID=37632 RepID=UPI002B49FEB1|nr:hypothetical protein [Amycolatopsis sp.]HKS46356.1 hypothetical protein [Amycolatopsis sp.]